MSNIQNIDVSLQEIVKNISKNSYLIPKFQRDFVWKNNDIIDLGDSIIRGYPISSLLIMAENGSLNVSSHGLVKDTHYQDLNKKSEEIKFYVLDGQQRLTSISKLFLNLDKKNEYYFDLLSMLVSEYRNDDILKDSGVKNSFLKSNITDIFCRSFPITKDKSEKPTRQNNRFISGKTIIDNKFGSVINKFLNEFKDIGEEKHDKYIDYLNAVFGAVGGYSIPATVIARDSELGVVIRVFEKVNSTGKKLTLFDLINAKSFQTDNEKYQGGLADFLTKSVLEETSKNNQQAVSLKNYLKFNEENNTFEKLGKIVRILEISSLLSAGLLPSIFQSTMLEKDPDFWFESWNNNADLFIDVISWIYKEGLADIGQTTYIEYIASIFLANPKAFTSSTFKDKIKKYAFYLSLSSTPFNKSNLETVEQIYTMSKKIINHLDYSDLSYSLNLTESNILQINPSSSKFSAILNLFYIDKVKGLFTHDIGGASIKSEDIDIMDRHHIFPKSKVENFTYKSEFNSIANFILIANFENREVFKDHPPSIYLSKLLQNMSQDDLKRCCDMNLVSYSDFINVTHEAEALPHIRKRAGEIANILNSEFTTTDKF